MASLKDKPWKIALALGLGAVAILMFARMLITTGPAPATPSAAPMIAAGQSAPAARPAIPIRRGQRAPAIAEPSLDPTLRLDLLRASEETSYEGKGRNIFRQQEERAAAPIPDPVAPPVIPRDPEEVRPAGPPPIPLKFFGFASRDGEPRQVFLSEGEDVYIAKEGDIVGRRYRVLRIGNNAVEIEDVLNNRRQTIPLTQG